ncbi:alpha/beta hydrolase [Streptomyces sp. NPDC051896]|uniref:alpha/beta hydrolase n=1 Tax=Streptomyces sp. NPDC051896 TaxID=3155416 RepID=UPI00343F4256
MAQVVAVHGIAQQFKGARVLETQWAPALRDGLSAAGCLDADSVSVRVAFFGDLFRPSGKGIADVQESLADDVEEELLAAYLRHAHELEPERVPDPDTEVTSKGPLRTGGAVAARRLLNTWFFSHLPLTLLISHLRQVASYLRDSEMRQAMQQRVLDAIDDDTRVVVGHSLGSVVAYETLALHPLKVASPTLVTLGSPLGHDVVRRRLTAAPDSASLPRPGGVARWVNVADIADVVALRPRLAAVAAGPVEDLRIRNGAQAHDVGPYLTSAAVGGVACAALH